MLEGKARKAEEDLQKEMKKNGKLELEKSELQLRAKTGSGKAATETQLRSKTISSATTSIGYLEKEVYKRDVELARLREIVKNNAFGFNQRFTVAPEFKKYYPASGLRADDENVELLTKMLQESKMYSRDVADENQTLRDFVSEVYETACQLRKQKANPRTFGVIATAALGKKEGAKVLAEVLNAIKGPEK